MAEDGTPNVDLAEKAESALLLIDVINDLEFEGAERLLPYAEAAAKRIAALKKRARREGIPVIYVNDNFGRWQSDFHKQIAHVLRDGVRGEGVAEQLLPDEEDYFVLKPLHSGFYSTTLDVLLEHLGAKTLILTGFATEICVLFTANDAYMRDYRVIVPEDCVASNEERFKEHALSLMRRVLKADTRPSTELDLGALAE